MSTQLSLRLVATVAAAAAVGAIAARTISARAHNSAEIVPTENSSAHSADAWQAKIPPSEADAPARLNSSARHGQWVTFPSGRNPATGANDSTRAWLVFPERADKAPVVVVIHEIFGLTPWVRAVTDQLAADGFIAIAPDFLTMKNVPGNPADGPDRQQATTVIRSVTPEEVNRYIDAAAKYGMALPAATQKYGVVGYCWGGQASFAHAVHAPSLSAAVVYYGTSPAPGAVSAIRAPVLGLYAQNDARVNNSVPPVDSAMKALNKPFTQHTFEGAGHGFLRQGSEANVAASVKAWPLTVQFFKTHLEGR